MYFKITGPKKVTCPNFFNFFCNTSHYKSKDASLAVISFAVIDLLLCFLSVFQMADDAAGASLSAL